MLEIKWRKRQPEHGDTLFFAAGEWVASIGLDEVLPAVFGDGKAAAYILDYRKARHIVCIVDTHFDAESADDRSQLLREAEVILGRAFEQYGYEIGVGNAAAFFDIETNTAN